MIHLEVVTPERKVFEADVDSVEVPGFDGELGILPGHTELVSKLKPAGLLTYHIGEERGQMVTRMAIEVLSGGMSGRLFTEVREKRGLVYSVGASYSSLKGLGSIFGYAGTSNERAQATLDCFITELHRLTQGVTKEELDRANLEAQLAENNRA